MIEPGFINTDIVEHAPKAAASFEPYKSARVKPVEIFRRWIKDGVSPDVVARTVTEAALADYPRLSYLPDGVASLAAFLHTAFPAPLFDFAFRKQMHIDG